MPIGFDGYACSRKWARVGVGMLVAEWEITAGEAGVPWAGMEIDMGCVAGSRGADAGGWELGSLRKVGLGG